jgi:hypothetical protein
MTVPGPRIPYDEISTRGNPAMRKATLLITTAGLLLCACEVSRVDPLSIPLAYSQNPKNAGQLGSLSCNSVSQLQVQDARADKVLGVRTHESKPLKADVSASTDPAAWVHEGVQSFLTQNGINFSGAGPRLQISLDSLNTTESIWHRASYAAGIALTARLQSPAGKVCWKTTVQGHGGNYGYAGSVLNYQETLNEALDDATLAMSNAGFKDALCHCSD